MSKYTREELVRELRQLAQALEWEDSGEIRAAADMLERDRRHLSELGQPIRYGWLWTCHEEGSAGE